MSETSNPNPSGPDGWSFEPDGEAPRPADVRPSHSQPAAQPVTVPPTTRNDRPGNLSTLIVVLSAVIFAVVLMLQERSIGQLQQAVGILQSNARGIAVQASDEHAPTTIDVRGAPALGPASAAVTLVEFSDYECPYCIRHFQQTMPQIRAAYIDTGKIRYVFKDFPIDDNHPMAIRAHEAAHCAMEQNKFWPLHMKLFSAPGTHTPPQLEARATEAGLDLTAFRACIASGRTTATIRASAALASRLGADGTPSFFIGLRDPATDQVRVTKSIDGAESFPAFQETFDALLKSK